MNKEKYDVLKTIIPGKYRVKMVFNNSKLGIEIYKDENQEVSIKYVNENIERIKKYAQRIIKNGGWI